MLRYLLFGLPFLVVLGGLHYYQWRRLIHDVWPPGRRRDRWTIAYLGCVALWGVGTFAARRHSHRAPGWLRIGANAWTGLLALSVTLLLAAEAVRLIQRLLARRAPDPERRLFFAKLLAGSTAAATAGLGLLGAGEALRRVRVKRVTVELEKLGGAAEGYRIVQLTDMHIGSTLGGDFVEEVVATVEGLKPDLVAITGDLVDGSIQHLDPLLQPLRRLAPRDGVYFVTGNHEYYAGAGAWLQHLPLLGIRPLRNERVKLAGFELAGVHDWSARYSEDEERADLARAMAGRDPEVPVVLLAHQPHHAEEAQAHGVDLQLAGHTHGGQMFPVTALVHLTTPFVTGLYRRGRFQIYVSAGTGFWGPPMRLGTEAEITEITLRRAPGSGQAS